MLHELNLQSSTPVQIYCDCEFFKYNLAYSLYKTNSLLYPESFFLRPPKVKNTSLTLSGCKHVILVANTIYQNRRLINLK